MQILFIFKYLVCSQKSKMQEQEKNAFFILLIISKTEYLGQLTKT